MGNRKGRTRIIGTSPPNGLSTGWFGYGQDGDLNVEAGQTVTLPVEEDTGQIIKYYQNLTIGAGSTLRPAARNNGTVILVKGDLLIEGTLSVDCCAPLANDAEAAAKQEPHIVLAGTLTGGAGHSGEGGSGVGGNGFWCGGGYGGGGGSYYGGDSEPRPPKGITWPYPAATPFDFAQDTARKSLYGAGESTSRARGGAAPGGSGCTYNYCHNERDDVYYDTPVNGRPGNAYGGGGLWIYVQGNVTITETGKITANGGMGAKGVKGSYEAIYEKDDGSGYEVPWGDHGKYAESGGSGGGGIVFVTYGGTFTNNGTIEAAGGANAGNASDCSGSVGTVKTIPFNDLV